jgi:hypothetical protein
MFRRSVAFALLASASAFSTGAFAPSLRPAQVLQRATSVCARSARRIATAPRAAGGSVPPSDSLSAAADCAGGERPPQPAGATLHRREGFQV